MATNAEINEAVARKLGYKPTEWVCGEWRYPDYCHSIETAWEIVEFVSADRFRILKAKSIPKWSAIFEFQNPEDKKIKEYFASEDTPSMAICLAFLKLR